MRRFFQKKSGSFWHQYSSFSGRCQILHAVFWGIFLVFALRLFQLQVLDHQSFAAQARAQHEKRSVLPARRGKILVRKNRLTDEVTPLATNNTLKQIFVDPLILHFPEWNPSLDVSLQEKGDPDLAAEILAPILIHAHCEKVEGCTIETDPENWTPAQSAAISAYQSELEKIFSSLQRTRVIIATEISPSRADQIAALGLRGISISGSSVLADPTAIRDVPQTAKTLAPILGQKPKTLEPLLTKRYTRYIPLAKKIVPEVSASIAELKSSPEFRKILRGVALRDEYWRYYPEKNLAAQTVGFVDSSGRGQYGIEGRFDAELRGREGFIFGATSVQGRRILGSEKSQFQNAQDGADILLSLDRVAQGAVEKILKEDLERFDADFGQIVVLEPETGKILALAMAPDFDPNEFGEIFRRFEISPEQETADRADPFFHQRVPTIFDTSRYFRYFNVWGPEVFRHKITADVYEPGSVVKAFTIAAALNADEITPQTTFDDRGPVEVDEFEIKNSDEIYAGTTTIIEVLNRSLNTGIAFITQKMGAQVLHQYLQNFGFSQYTDVQLEGEVSGQLEFWTDWEASELVTRGFGQGMTATPLQVALAFGALANGGYLMKPILVEEVRSPDGSVQKFLPQKVRRVLSDETSQTIKAMLLNSVNNGVARGARVRDYSVMGKTGTSQTYQNGKVLTGAGTTITSFAGFGPFKNPSFVILVKYDYPKTSQWGSETAAITFSRVAEFLFQHFKIPPEAG